MPDILVTYWFPICATIGVIFAAGKQLRRCHECQAKINAMLAAHPTRTASEVARLAAAVTETQTRISRIADDVAYIRGFIDRNVKNNND